MVSEEEVCSPCGGKGRSIGCIGSPCHITQGTGSEREERKERQDERQERMPMKRWVCTLIGHMRLIF